MDKLKRFLVLPVAYHGGLLLGMLISGMIFGLGGAGVFSVCMIADMLLGAIVTPMYLAVMSMAHAILHDGKVYDYLYKSLIYLGIIGVMRALVYLALVGFGSNVGANMGIVLVCLLVSVGVFVIWDCLFAFTDKMMKKRPGRRK